MQNLSKKKTRQGARAWPPFPGLVSTTGWATLFPQCRALAQRPFQARELCLGQGSAGYAAHATGNNKLWMFLQGARAWPPFPGLVSTTGWATLFPQCRALAQRPFQARELCLGQGSAGYGAHAIGNNHFTRNAAPSPGSMRPYIRFQRTKSPFPNGGNGPMQSIRQPINKSGKRWNSGKR